MSEIETPLCQELHASSLDSNDIRAWRSLAYRLERGLTLLGRSALSQEAVRDEDQTRIGQLIVALQEIINAPGGGPAKRIATQAIALKRGPNAALGMEHPNAAGAGPAPAAPDVAEGDRLLQSPGALR